MSMIIVTVPTSDAPRVNTDVPCIARNTQCSISMQSHAIANLERSLESANDTKLANKAFSAKLT